mgnify:CR=1 FL=1
MFNKAKIIGRRFKIVHVYTAERKYFEVTTFRSDVKKKTNEKKFKKIRIFFPNVFVYKKNIK